jgi:hypothetical protein
MLNQWLVIMVCNAEQVIMYYGEVCCASGCESWCPMLRQWLCIMLCYACESWFVMLSQEL